MKILIIMAISGFVLSKTPVSCPSNCNCDKLANLKRVKCSNQNLMNIGNDIPLSVEILDISYNQINQLYENEFTDLGLKSLKFLNISHNKIGHMHLNAFKNLNKIRILDLSYNVIEYILLEWFYSLPNLKELYLNDNNFFKLVKDGPLIESKTLEVLDISFCKITFLKPEAFTSLPKLKTLKLDGNFLIEINTIHIKGLKTLQSLSVSGNPFSCGRVMNDLKKYLRNNNVKYVDPCTKPKLTNVERSQKMITLEEPDKNSLWMYEDDIDDNSTICNCTKFDNKEQGIVLEIIELSPILSLIIPLVTGLVLGMIIACNVQIKPSKRNVHQRPRRYSVIRKTYMENSDPLVLHCENIDESTPMPQRRIEMYQLR